MSKPFTLVQLRYFSTVVDTGSMTAAASNLMVTQSAVSSAMSELEHALDVQLFVRHPHRPLALTSAGREISKELGSFLEQADRMRELAQGLGGGLTGELRVGVFSPLAPVRLPLILNEFEKQYPGVAVSVVEANLANMQEELIAGHCDVALTYDLGIGSGFHVDVIEEIPPHAIVSTSHAAAKRQHIWLRELADEPLILLDMPHTRQYYESLFRSIGVTPNVRHRFAGYETVRSFVASGHGYSLLNQKLSHDMTYSGSSVVPLGLLDELPSTSVLLVRPASVRPTRKVLAFEGVCRHLYRSG